MFFFVVLFNKFAFFLNIICFSFFGEKKKKKKFQKNNRKKEKEHFSNTCLPCSCYPSSSTFTLENLFWAQDLIYFLEALLWSVLRLVLLSQQEREREREQEEYCSTVIFYRSGKQFNALLAHSSSNTSSNGSNSISIVIVTTTITKIWRKWIYNNKR